VSAVPEPAAVPRQRLLVLDFGSQYTQLIARRVREAGIYSEIHPGDWQDERVADFRPRAVILSGGPGSAAAPAAGRIPEAVFRLDVPVLGICYGMQAMAAQLGGGVEAAGRREFGPARVRARGHSRLLRGIQDAGNEQGHGLLDVWMSHGDRVSELPPGFKVIASTPDSPVAAMADESRRLYGLQFHPEVTHTRQGEAILRRFLYEIAGCEREWTPGHIAERTIREIRARVGERDKVLHALSGGVDSAVAALLLHRALGEERLQCVFVDNGLLRLGEADEVMATFADRLGLPVRRVEAAEQLDDDINAGIVDDIVRVARQRDAAQIRRAPPLEVARHRAPDLDAAPGAAPDFIGVARQHIQRAAADGAKPQQAHRNRFHFVPPNVLLMLRTAWRMRCSFSMRLKRRWPSPYSPKPTPGETATCARSSSILANSSDPIARNSSGSGAHTNIVARGLSNSQPALASPSHSTSRRLQYSCRVCSTQSCGPSSALMAAICTGMNMP